MAEPRVLFVSSHAADGGSEQHLQRLLVRLAGRTSVAGVVVLQDGPLVQRLRDDGWDATVIDTGVGPLSVLVSAWRLRRVVLACAPDVVHSNGVKAALVSAVGRLTPPVVWNKHDHAFDGRVGRWVARRCAAVVAVSASSLAAVARAARRTAVLPPLVGPVVASRDGAGGRLVALTGSDAPVVVCVGRVERAKGQLDVVNAFARVIASTPAHLLLVGGPAPTEPDHLETVRHRVAECGLTSHVTFAGYRYDVPDLVAGAAVLVVASHAVGRSGMGAEGYGLAAVEAMAVGTPVVAYDSGALSEVVGDCGLLVPPRDLVLLAGALISVLTDPGRAGAMAACGTDRVAGTLDGARTVEGLIAIYEDLAAKA